MSYVKGYKAWRRRTLAIVALALTLTITGCKMGSTEKSSVLDAVSGMLVQEKIGGRYSLIDLDGNVMVEDEYDLSQSQTQISIISDGIYGLKTSDEGYTLYKVAKTPQRLSSQSFTAVGIASDGVIPVQQNSGAPLVLSTKDGSVLFEVNEYSGSMVEEIGDNFFGGVNYYAVKDKSGYKMLYGLINSKGEYVTKPVYSKIIGAKHDKVIGVLPSENYDRMDIEVLSSKGKLLFSTTLPGSASVLIGESIIVGDDKIFDLKGNVVKRLPAHTIAFSIGGNDHILVVDQSGNEASIINKKGETIFSIRHLAYATFDRTGNHVIAGESGQGDEMLFTIYQAKDGKELFSGSGSDIISLRGGKFLLRQRNEYVLFDAKGSEVKDRYYSEIVSPYRGINYLTGYSNGSIKNTYYPLAEKVKETLDCLLLPAEKYNEIAGQRPDKIWDYLYETDYEAEEAFSEESGTQVENSYFELTPMAFGNNAKTEPRRIFTFNSKITEFDIDEYEYKVNPNARLLMVNTACQLSDEDVHDIQGINEGYQSLMNEIEKYVSSNMGLKRDDNKLKSMCGNRTWDRYYIGSRVKATKSSALFTSPQQKFDLLVYLYDNGIELISITSELNDQILSQN